MPQTTQHKKLDSSLDSESMRDYGRIYSSFWTSADIRALTDDGKLLAAYLLSSPHTTIAGVFRLPDGYASEDLGWGLERVTKGFVEHSNNGFSTRCETTKWVWIRKFFEWNAPENPNQWKSAQKAALLVPSACSWRLDFYELFLKYAGENCPEFGVLTGTLSKPLPTPESESESESESEQAPEPEGAKKAKGGCLTDVRTVFGFWQTTFKHSKAVLDQKRLGLIKQRLGQYTVDQLCKCLAGYSKSPFHMGDNDKHKIYDDIELFLRDAKHVEDGMKMFDVPPISKRTAKTTQELEAEEAAKNANAQR